MTLSFVAGGCPPEFSDIAFYEPTDRISANGVVFECKSWPLSLFCSQEWFKPDYSLTEPADHYKRAWQVVGYCTGAKPIPGGVCPAEWAAGDAYTKYKENDQVSVVKTYVPLVKVVYKCKLWPYSWYCGLHSPIDYNGGQLGWDFVGECNPGTPVAAPTPGGAGSLGTPATLAPTTTVAPTKSPVFVSLSSVGACPPTFTEAAYEPGDRVSKDSVVFECKSWPLSLYCAQKAFTPDLKSTSDYWKRAWQVVGHCTGTITPGVVCPAAWTSGDMNKYKENDQVSVIKSSIPNAKVIYKCKAWPYTWYCGQISPLDSTGGTLGWEFVGECV